MLSEIRNFPDKIQAVPDILRPKGGNDMKLTGLAISMGVGLAAGAVTAAMLPRGCTAKKAIQKAAYAVEDAACNAKVKINDKLDRM